MNSVFFKSLLKAILLLFFFVWLPFVLAADLPPQKKDTDSIQEQINAIQQKLDLLWLEYFKIVDNLPIIKEISEKFKNEIAYGSSGEDVRLLQGFLSNFLDIYPEKIITGYFGGLTEKAVKRFQKKYGLELTGKLDLPTRRLLNNFYFMKAEEDWAKENLKY